MIVKAGMGNGLKSTMLYNMVLIQVDVHNRTKECMNMDLQGIGQCEDDPGPVRKPTKNSGSSGYLS